MIKAIGHFVIVRCQENPSVSGGGIQLIETDSPAEGIGTVLSVGHLVADVISDQQVMFPRYAGTEIHINHECFLVLRDTDILATLGT